MAHSRIADDLQPADYPLVARETIRYADTDRQGHVNNAVFSTLFETGRVQLLYAKDAPLHAQNCSFVIANLNISFLAELAWPGEALIHSGIAKIGTSSIHLVQSIYQDTIQAATAQSVIVHVDSTTGRSAPLTDGARAALTAASLPSRSTS